MPDTLELTQKDLDEKIALASSEAVEKAMEEASRKKAEEKGDELTDEQKAELEKKETEKNSAMIKNGIEAFLKSIPSSQRKEFGFPALISERGDKCSFGEFLRAVNGGNNKLLKEKYKSDFNSPEVKVIVEGTPTSGGYLVPVEYEKQILRLIEDESIVRQLCSKTTMKYLTKNRPIVTSGITAYFVDENSEKTKSDWTLGQLQLVAKKICTLTSLSNEELDDSDPDAEDVLMQEFAISIANREDLAMLNGAGSGATDPWTGIYNLSGAVSDTMGATFDFDKLLLLIGKIKGNRAKKISILYNPIIEGLMRSAKGNDGQYLWAPATASTPQTFAGYKCYEAYNIPTNLGTGLDETFIAAGDFSNAFVGDKGGIVVAKGFCDQDFEYDRTSFRAVKRTAFTVHSALQNRFAVLSGIKVPA